MLVLDRAERIDFLRNLLAGLDPDELPAEAVRQLLAEADAGADPEPPHRDPDLLA